MMMRRPIWFTRYCPFLLFAFGGMPLRIRVTLDGSIGRQDSSTRRDIENVLVAVNNRHSAGRGIYGI
jgi:hypothetical protein